MKSLLLFVAIILNIRSIVECAYVGGGFDAKTGSFAAPIFIDNQYSTKPYIMSSETLYQNTYYTYDQYISEYRKWYDFEIGLNFASFSAGYKYSKLLEYIRNQITSQQYAIIDGYHSWTWENKVMWPAFVSKLNPMFIEAMKSDKIITDPTYLNEFVQTFGTHYISRTVSGGKVNFVASLYKNYIETHTFSEVITQYELYFHLNLFDISAGGFTNKSDIKIDQDFLSNVDYRTFFYGGDPTLANLNKTDQWIQSIQSNQYPINMTLAGIWELLPSPKNEIVKRYIMNYLSSSFILPIKDTPIHPCLGSGVDTTTANILCLNNVYHPIDDTTFNINIPDTQLIEFSVIMQSSFDVNAYYHSKTESNGFLGFGSKSEEIWKYYKNYYTESKSLSKIILTISYIKSIAPALPYPTKQMDPVFMEALTLLPIYNRSNYYIYDQFIKSWGTAVIDEVVLGGQFESNIWYDRMFNSYYSEDKIDESSHWSFIGIIGNGHGQSSDKVHIDTKFNESMYMEYMYDGGNITMKPNQYLDWAGTVANNMAVIKYHLIPITYFVLNETVKKWIDTAILDYSQRSIDDLNNEIAKLKHY